MSFSHQKKPATSDKLHADEVDVLVIGAGAAGLFCAFQAAQQLQGNGRVRVIDHANKAGKKILMSGGGKCNFTNYFVESENYLSGNLYFCKSALSRYTNWDFIGLIEKHGVAYEERKHGQLFCLNSAKDILNMLLSECEQAGVSVQCKTRIDSIKVTDAQHFIVKTTRMSKQGDTQEVITCDKLVIATGGLSIPTMGATGFGYEVAAQFGHTLRPRRAGLVPFTFTDDVGDMTKALSGNAIDVTATDQHEQASFTEAMLFTHRGLSGPAMLQISNYWQPSETVSIDLKPSEDLSAYLLTQKREKPKTRIRTVLFDHFPKNVVLALQQRLWQNVAEKPLGDIANDVIEQIGYELNHWQLKPSGTEGYRTAEVTLGGVCVDEVSSQSMESKKQANLYFVGEVLDVTGWLGGYNFQWAWSSAYACAQAVADV